MRVQICGLIAVAVLGTYGQKSLVSLKGTINNDTLILACMVCNLTFDVTIISPDGEIIGSCIAPVRHRSASTEPTCTGNLTQNVHTNTTYLERKKTNGIIFSGTWKCLHGTNRGEDYLTVTDVEDRLSIDDRESSNCYVPALVTLFTTVLVTVLIIVTTYKCNLHTRIMENLRKPHKVKKTIYSTEKESLLSEEKKVHADDQESLKPDEEKDTFCLSKCNTCTNLTAFSYCKDCGKVYCEVCFEHHSSIISSHTIIQIEHIKVPVHSVKCMSCKSKYDHRICLRCQKTFCETCKCDEEHGDKFMKPLLLKPLAEMRSKSDTKISINLNDTKRLYSIPISHETLPTRICGIAFLIDKYIAVADCSNNKVKVFLGKELKFSLDLHKEPRCMIGLYDNKVGLTFPYEREIAINDIDITKERQSTTTIDMHGIGKPYNMAYNQERFAVEIGTGDDGFIVILNSNGEKLAEIKKAVNYAFFTGHTIRLALDTHGRKVFISAMSKKAVTCLDFDGKEIWGAQVTSPRGAIFAYGNQTDKKRTIFVASKRGNTIYQISPSSGAKDVLIKEILNPRHIAFNSQDHLLCIQSVNEDGDEEDKLIIYNCNPS